VIELLLLYEFMRFIQIHNSL